jgi:hypothetical protein
MPNQPQNRHPERRPSASSTAAVEGPRRCQAHLNRPSPSPSKSPHFRPSLALIATSIFLTGTLQAQTIPATNPTTPPSALNTNPAPIAQPPPTPIHRAQIAFSNNLLTITADNSSLNQILRDIASTTGMTITGGVADERVFGTYGPADPSTVLAALLNGTGSNILLIQDSKKSPRELILTPRHGGPTPPSPNTYHDASDNNLPPQQTPHFSKEPARQAPLPQLPPDQQVPPPPAATVAPTPDSSTPATAPDANTTTQQSPNGVKTPQQIYEELMKMQQQQAKPATPPPQ